MTDVTAVESSVANFFTPSSKKEPERIAWSIAHNTLLFGRYRPPQLKNEPKPLNDDKVKIAAFDLVSVTSLQNDDFT